MVAAVRRDSRLTDRIFVQHTGQLTALARQWRSKAYVLPKVCDIDTSPPKSHDDRVPYVAWVGTLVHFKRPDALVHIASKMPTVQFVVGGGMPPTTRPTLTLSSGYTASRTSITWDRFHPRRLRRLSRMPRFSCRHPTWRDSPNTFVQAWSSGTPVITLKIDPDGIIERIRLGAVVGTVDRAITEIGSHRQDATAPGNGDSRPPVRPRQLQCEDRRPTLRTCTDGLRRSKAAPRCKRFQR